MKAMVDYCKMKAQVFASKFLYEENGDVNIVSMVVLIGIAVVLAIFFKDQIGQLLFGLFAQIGTKADSTMTDVK